MPSNGQIGNKRGKYVARDLRLRRLDDVVCVAAGRDDVREFKLSAPSWLEVKIDKVCNRYARSGLTSV